VPPGTAAGQLYVESTVPGAWIDVRPLDETLEGGGFVDFERVYPLTTVVTLTAEMSLHGQCFFAWQIDGEMQEPGENTVQFVMNGSMTVKALYRAPVFWMPGRRKLKRHCRALKRRRTSLKHRSTSMGQLLRFRLHLKARRWYVSWTLFCVMADGARGIGCYPTSCLKNICVDCPSAFRTPWRFCASEVISADRASIP
jgi:hypothetical protein